MNIIIKGREMEVRDLNQKLGEVNFMLHQARAEQASDLPELERTANALKKCIMAAESELEALSRWGMRRGLATSQPASPKGYGGLWS
jgi:hypothetical protein